MRGETWKDVGEEQGQDEERKMGADNSIRRVGSIPTNPSRRSSTVGMSLTTRLIMLLRYSQPRGHAPSTNNTTGIQTETGFVLVCTISLNVPRPNSGVARVLPGAKSRNYFASEHRGEAGRAREGQPLSGRAGPYSGNKWAAVNIVVHINHGRRPDAAFWGRKKNGHLDVTVSLCYAFRAWGVQARPLTASVSGSTFWDSVFTHCLTTLRQTMAIRVECSGCF
ncbi:hypothetical protein E2C01_030323 [Portunus trituberculatus]|uniref:Uncharacterized protein n=1 Tax=Portunus trituberculatus TaxID=210409 RepID=A0A5B7EUJ9_PORTR|nr:hypothetical protein [Portunus trituberculatus]